MKKASLLLTEVELELMTIIWRRQQAGVNDVLAALPADRALAYTSVSTILRILEQKGVLKARKEGRGHIYIPVLSKAEFEARTVDHVVQKVFDGTPMALVRQLLGHAELTEEDLNEVKRLLAEKEKKP